MIQANEIQANELRIGNYVMWEDESNEIERVNGVYSDDDDICFIDFEGGSALLESFKPIPIDEEWLIKFNFSNNGGGYYFISSKTHTYAYCLSSRRFYNIDGDDFSIAHNIKYVHELQNIYFALTKKELI